MDLLEIPFSKHIGIKKEKDGTLMLCVNERVKNHINTIHASAQYTLAETQSAYYLESNFPQYEGEIIPLLRSSSVKYKNPAIKDIYAKAFTSKELLEKFEEQFLKKGRALISVEVNIYDSDNTLTMMGIFTWFIQKI